MAVFKSYNKTQTIVTKADSADGATNPLVDRDEVTQISVQELVIDGMKIEGSVTVTSNNLTSVDTPIIKVQEPQNTWTEEQFDQISTFRSELATLADSLKLHGGV